MKIYLVGGAVRDKILGLTICDKDWVVVGSSEDEMKKLGFKRVIKNIPVFLHPITKEEYALARKEKKNGLGYYGFKFISSKQISLKEDLMRRDLTINSIAIGKNNKIYDPCNGIADIKNRILKHTSQAFCEDPLRVIRTARFAAKLYHLNFKISKTTMLLMKNMTKQNELNNLPGERIQNEFRKVFLTKNPEIFFTIMRKINAFYFILRPLNQVFLNQNVFLPIKIALRHKCYNFNILFTLLTYSIPKKSDILALSKEIKISSKLEKLILDTHFQSKILENLLQYNEITILNMIKSTNIINNEKHKQEFITVCKFIRKSKNIKNFTLYYIKEIINKLKFYPYKNLINKEDNKLNIGKKIEQKKIKLIKEVLNSINN